MGRWFPGIRTGTKEQVREYKGAHKDLFRNSRYESNLRTADGRRAIQDESPRHLRLNGRAHDSGAPLSRTQQRWHWQRALGAEDRDFTRMQRDSDKQTRAGRKTRTLKGRTPR